jgi:hypothetical protein
VSPPETLFRLEIEFHRRLRTQAPGTADLGSLHTSYALQFGYDQLIRSLGPVTARDLEVLKERLMMAGDARDVLASTARLSRESCIKASSSFRSRGSCNCWLASSPLARRSDSFRLCPIPRFA